MARRGIDAERGDTYAVAASDSALGAIDQAVTAAVFAHSVTQPKRALRSTPDALQRLRNVLGNTKRCADQPKVEAIQRSLDDIYRLTHARDTELKLRSAEFRSASLPGANPVLDRETLERWLRTQADAAPGTDIEHSYFTRLAEHLPGGRDPWMVSRELMRSLPSPDNAEQAQRLQDAHRRLVRAIACGLSEQRSEFGDSNPPSHVDWKVVYGAIQARMVRETRGADVYAAAAGAAALLDIGHAARYAYFTHRLRGSLKPPSGPLQILPNLRGLRDFSKHIGDLARAEAIQQSLDEVYRLSLTRHAELMLRSREFRSALHPPGAPVP
ncbi:MAG: hypothetical protein OXE40_01610, partial [Gammaproteobacteria bacterium]|nr:hypothetical protein [Gammaproteobacteria bacterium]